MGTGRVPAVHGRSADRPTTPLSIPPCPPSSGLISTPEPKVAGSRPAARAYLLRGDQARFLRRRIVSRPTTSPASEHSPNACDCVRSRYALAAAGLVEHVCVALGRGRRRLVIEFAGHLADVAASSINRLAKVCRPSYRRRPSWPSAPTAGCQARFRKLFKLRCVPARDANTSDAGDDRRDSSSADTLRDQRDRSGAVRPGRPELAMGVRLVGDDAPRKTMTPRHGVHPSRDSRWLKTAREGGLLEDGFDSPAP